MFVRRRVTVSRVRIEASPERVWEVIRPAETGPLLDPRCVEAWSEAPAGPRGPEVQVHVIADQGARIRVRTVILEERPGVFARTELVSAMCEDPPGALPVAEAGSEFLLEPLEDGTTMFVHTQWERSRRTVRRRAAARAATRAEQEWEQEYLRRTKELSESGERPS